VFKNDDILPLFLWEGQPPVSLGKEGTRTVEIETVDHQRLEMTKTIVENWGAGPVSGKPIRVVSFRFPP